LKARARARLRRSVGARGPEGELDFMGVILGWEARGPEVEWQHKLILDWGNCLEGAEMWWIGGLGQERACQTGVRELE
jgi:hypothetical protein